MPEISTCPKCQAEVSRYGLCCRSCWTELNDVPPQITPDLIESLRDVDLADLLYRYVVELEQADPRSKYSNIMRTVLSELPRPIRAGWTLVVLESEVLNGGFEQWLTNSSGETADLAVQDLLLIEAAPQAALAEEALSLSRKLEASHPMFAGRWANDPRVSQQEYDAYWADFNTNYSPEFERITDEFYRLQDAAPFWPLLDAYVRREKTSCIHSRRSLSPSAQAE